MTRATTSRLDYLGLGHIWSWRPDSNGLSPGYKAGTLSLRASPANFMEPKVRLRSEVVRLPSVCSAIELPRLLEPVSRIARESPLYEGGTLLIELHRLWTTGRELHPR